MKILILGATGATGQQLVTQALEKGHKVTVLVRTPAKLKLSHENLTVIEGNVLDETILRRALTGKEAVLSALGVGNSLKSSGLIAKAVGTLIPAMQATDVTRVIFLSAFGVGATFVQSSSLQKVLYRFLLRNIYEDKAKGDAQLRHSTLDWTLVYPVILTNGPRTGNYKVGEQLPMKGLPKVSRADVADFMLQQLIHPTFIRKEPLIMS